MKGWLCAFTYVLTFTMNMGRIKGCPHWIDFSVFLEDVRMRERRGWKCPFFHTSPPPTPYSGHMIRAAMAKAGSRDCT